MTIWPRSLKRVKFHAPALTLNDKLASWVIAAAVFGLVIALCASVAMSCFKHTPVQRLTIEFVPADSIAVSQVNNTDGKLMLSKEFVDSIVSRIELHESQLAQKYQHILEKRDDEDNYRNIFMLVFGIVVSVVGFFGYRSFSDVAENATSIAETKAVETATTKATEVANSTAETVSTSKATEIATAYCSQHVPQAVADYLNENLQTLVNSRVTSIFNNEGRAAIIREITENFNASITTHIDQYINSDDFKSLVSDAVEQFNARQRGNGDEESPDDNGDGANPESEETGNGEVPVGF